MAPSITWGTLWAVHLLGTLAVSSLQHCVVHGAGGLSNVEAPDNPHHYGKENILQDEGASGAGTVTVLRPHVASYDARLSGATSIRGTKTEGVKNRSKRRLQPWRNRPRSEAAWAAYLALAAAGSSLLLLRSAIRGSLVPAGPSQPTIDLASKSVKSLRCASAGPTVFSQHSHRILSAALITAAVLLTLYIVVHSSTVGSINVPGRKASMQHEIQRTPSATAVRECVPNTSEPAGNAGAVQAAPADPDLSVRCTHQPDSRSQANIPSSSVSRREGGSSQRTYTKPTQDDGDAAGQAIAAALELPKAVVKTLQRAFATTAAREQTVTMGSLAAELRPVVWLTLGLTGGILLGHRLYWALYGHGEPHAEVQRTPVDTQALAASADEGGKAEGLMLDTGHNSSPAREVRNLISGEQLQTETTQNELNRWYKESMELAQRGAVCVDEMIEVLEELRGPLGEPIADSSPAPEVSLSEPVENTETGLHTDELTNEDEEELEAMLRRGVTINHFIKVLQGFQRQGKYLMRKAKYHAGETPAAGDDGGTVDSSKSNIGCIM